MQVGQLAARTGASARSIRHYDRFGLLPSVRRSNGYREFDESAIGRVQIIQRLLVSGLTLRDIVTLQPCLTAAGEFDGCQQARLPLRQHIERLESAIAKDRATLRLLREREANMTPDIDSSLAS